MDLINNKYRLGLWIAFLLLLWQLGCKKMAGYNEIVSKDLSKPAPVTDVKVENFSGGAFITYKLPVSDNILYVQAQYKINAQKSRQTKSSYYSDTIQVDGFAKSQDYQVVLRTVSRANVSSDSLVVTVHPLTPPYLLVARQLKIEQDFGGVFISAVNKAKANVGIITLTPDSTNKLAIKNQNYTNFDSIAYSLRGFDTLSRRFGVYVTDKWGNRSDTLFATIKPIYETSMDKGLFRPYKLSTDVLPFENNDSWGVKNLWDNNIGEPTYNTEQPIQSHDGKSDIWPAWVTFDMGREAKLSRYNLVGRGGDNGEFLWSEGSPATWVLWGRADTPQDELMPSDTTELPAIGSATPNGWINMGVFHAPPKPSGLPNPQFTTADWDFWKSGFNFNLPLSLPKIRYIRFECLENMGHTNNFYDFNEITFFGDPR